MFKWGLLLLLIAASPTFSRNPASMITPLAKLNQELGQKHIKEKKKITDVEFKALRTRLNLEISSAQKLNDHENEIFKLLSYTTYAVSLTKKSDQIKTLKTFWNKLFQLPVSSDNRALPNDFFGELAKPQNYYDYIQFLEFYTGFFPQENPPLFVFEFIRMQCDFYSEFHVKKKFYSCLKRLEPFTTFRPTIRNLISNYELHYLSRVKTDHSEFLKVASNNLQAFPKASTVHTATLIRSAIHEILNGNASQCKTYLEEIKSVVPTSPIINSIEANLFFIQDDYDKARKSFALLNLPSTEADESARYYFALGAIIDVAQNEFESATVKLKKHMDLTKNIPLHGMRTHLSLLILQTLSKSTIDVEANQKLIHQYESIINKLKIQNPYLKVSLKIMKTLLQAATAENQQMAQLKSLHKELSVHEFKFGLPFYLLSKLIEAADSGNLSAPAQASSPSI